MAPCSDGQPARSGRTQKSPAGTALSVDDPRIVRELEAYAAALGQGGRPDRRQILQKYPRIARELGECLDGLELVHQIGPPLEGTWPEDSAADEASGSRSGGVLGDFRILREIGRGGMGIVYEAEQISLKRRVALKILPFAAVLDEKQLQRFKNEAQAAASLKHPNIVHVYSVGCERAVHFYAMEYIEGRTLTEVIDELRRLTTADARDEANAGAPISEVTCGLIGDRVGNADGQPDRPEPEVDSDIRLPGTERAVEESSRRAEAAISTEGSTRTPGFFRAVVRLCIQAAEALEHAHQLGVVHRDVKPSNLMISADGHLWITDFGLAQTQTGANITLTGDVLGTLRYMSPEQAGGQRNVLDFHTDIYSLGATLYELLALEPAFADRDRHNLIHRIIDGSARPLRGLNPSTPRDLETIVLKAMATEPENRYGSARELADDLRRFLDHRPVLAKRPSPMERGAKWARRHISLVVSTAVASLIAVAAMTVSIVLIGSAHKEALRQRDLAEEGQRLVEQRERTLRRHLYAADLKLAHLAWKNADLKRTLELLSRHRPDDGEEDIRGFEWHYLWALCNRDLSTLRGHLGEVYCVAFSPDGRTLASASEDGTIALWDVSTGRRRATLESHASEVNCVAFAPDGATLATAFDGGDVRLWESATGRRKGQLVGHKEDVFAVAFSPDGQLLATGGRDRAVKIWDAGTLQPRSTLQGHTDYVQSLAFSPDGKTLATASTDETVILWDLPGEKPRGTLVGHGDAVLCLAFSHDGKRLATASEDQTVKLWHADTGREQLTLLGHKSWVQCVAFSPDDRLVASAGKDASVRVWDVASGEETNVIRGHFGRVWWLAFSPDGNTLATAGADRTVKLWDPTARQDCQSGPANRTPIGHVHLAQNADLLAWLTRGQDHLLWDLEGGRLRAVLTVPGPSATYLTFSPDGSKAVTGHADGAVTLWSAITGKRIRNLGRHAALVSSAAFSPDDYTLATGGDEGELRLWDLARGEQRAAVRAGQGRIWALAFAPDSRVLATATADGSVALWDPNDGQRRATLLGGTGAVSWVTFSPDGSLLATAGSDRSIRLWDVETAGQLAEIAGHADLVRCVAFSPDGKTLASGSRDRKVKLWNVFTGQELFSLEAHFGDLDAVAFSPDGDTLVSAAELADGRGEVFIWSAATGPPTTHTWGKPK